MTATLRSAAHIAALEGLIIVSCSRRKLVSSRPVPALDLYQGALTPHLREHLPIGYRSRVRIVSAEHGLLHADEPIESYDHKLCVPAEAERLRARVTPRLAVDLSSLALRHVLVVLDPMYMAAVASLFDYAPPLGLTVMPHAGDWIGAAAVLARWGWVR
ncbi:DUF6884 domain-containing protein [Actinokineospora sp. NBRC 105648]|uniref:DUF6884 domain-containing protein n=1 Tax=Actinokineospora sp. NBRC 105648 TaxID=3032206 RepID=UPI0024A511BD|nr:DUF6884 domain-containing protein [Actinokineospora sp. NBRC 105648]GLZ37892.1 hypothetical protein Acsp05_15160 [Actinokineospora sp. NBRC 105648]